MTPHPSPRSTRRLRSAGRLLQAAGAAGLIITLGVLVPFGFDALLVVSFFNLVAVPAVVACICSMVTGRRLGTPGRSRLPAAASAVGLTLSALLALQLWTSLEPTSRSPLLSSSGALRVDQVLLALLALAGVTAAALIASAGRPQPLPPGLRGAAAVAAGLVVLLVGQVIALSQPRLELAGSSAQKRSESQTCREAKALPTKDLSELDVGGITLPEIAHTRVLGVTVLPPFPAPAIPEAITTVPVPPPGLRSYTDTDQSIVVAVLDPESDDLDSIRRDVKTSIKNAGLSITASSYEESFDKLVSFGFGYSQGSRRGGIGLISCGDPALVITETVDPARSGSCAPMTLQARCQAMRSALPPEYAEGRFSPELVKGRLVLDVVHATITPLSFLGQDLLEQFGSKGWRLVSSSCGEDCFGTTNPIAMAFSRRGMIAKVSATEPPSTASGGSDSVVRIHVEEG